MHLLFAEPFTELILGEAHRDAGSLAVEVGCQPSQQKTAGWAVLELRREIYYRFTTVGGVEIASLSAGNASTTGNGSHADWMSA